MKKIILGLAIAGAICFSFTTNNSTTLQNEVETVSVSGKITMINDTSSKVKVHTGSGSVSLNPRGGKTSFSCDTGKKVKVNGTVIFTNDSKYCGETIYLSKFKF